jgi:hypothetical protein
MKVAPTAPAAVGSRSSLNARPRRPPRQSRLGVNAEVSTFARNSRYGRRAPRAPFRVKGASRRGSPWLAVAAARTTSNDDRLARSPGAPRAPYHRQHIDVPVTIIEAGLSPAFLRRSCERLKRLMPQARTVTLANSGHHASDWTPLTSFSASCVRQRPRPLPARSRHIELPRVTQRWSCVKRVAKPRTQVRPVFVPSDVPSTIRTCRLAGFAGQPAIYETERHRFESCRARFVWLYERDSRTRLGCRPPG